jgi:hypothetical protein
VCHTDGMHANVFEPPWEYLKCSCVVCAFVIGDRPFVWFVLGSAWVSTVRPSTDIFCKRELWLWWDTSATACVHHRGTGVRVTARCELHGRLEVVGTVGSNAALLADSAKP